MKEPEVCIVIRDDDGSVHTLAQSVSRTILSVVSYLALREAWLRREVETVPGVDPAQSAVHTLLADEDYRSLRQRLSLVRSLAAAGN
jgi:chromosome segregation and condensation protein ScpB